MGRWERMPDDDVSIEELFAQLAEEWDDVYLARTVNPTPDGGEDRYCIRNHTDEGLGASDHKSSYGSTLREALTAALNGDYSAPWNEEL